MQGNNLKIKAYDDKYQQQLLTVWEESVVATHDFLSPTDFNEIKDIVRGVDFNALQVYCLMKDELLLGFIGVADKKIEMLFVDPKYFGHGYGKELANFAMTELAVDKLDVNEQNLKARSFYEKSGSETFERTEKDDQGRNNPLLRMRLKQPKQ